MEVGRFFGVRGGYGPGLSLVSLPVDSANNHAFTSDDLFISVCSSAQWRSGDIFG
jgi:hypothetical protein